MIKKQPNPKRLRSEPEQIISFKVRNLEE